MQLPGIASDFHVFTRIFLESQRIAYFPRLHTHFPGIAADFHDLFHAARVAGGLSARLGGKPASEKAMEKAQKKRAAS